MSYIAIVSHSSNRITKFQEFAIKFDADSHVINYGGFVYYNLHKMAIPDMFISGETVTEVSRVSLENYKKKAITKNQVEAGERIAALFDADYGSNKLSDRRFNDLIRYNELREKEVTRGAIITEPEQAEIGALRTKKDNINSIRNAENAAAAVIDKAADKAAVDEINVLWPRIIKFITIDRSLNA